MRYSTLAAFKSTKTRFIYVRIMEVFDNYRWLLQLLLSVFALVGYVLLVKLVSTGIRSWGLQHRKKSVRIAQVVRYIKGLMLVVLVAVVAVIWGIDYRGLWVVATSILAVLGVALFAQWSILSNVTSGVIVFFTFPARVGDFIEIIDGVNSVKGQLNEIGMFQIHLTDEEGNAVVYPNNLLLQKPVKKVQNAQKATKSPQRWSQRRHDGIL